jgi:hypothetical protein
MLHRTADIVSSVPHSGISLKVPPTYARQRCDAREVMEKV